MISWHIDVLASTSTFRNIVPGTWYEYSYTSTAIHIPVREATNQQHRQLVPARTFLPEHEHLVQLVLRHVLQPGRAGNESALLRSPLPPLLLPPPACSASSPPPPTRATTAHPLPGSHAWRGYSPARRVAAYLRGACHPTRCIPARWSEGGEERVAGRRERG